MLKQSMISLPAIVYVTVCGMHIAQQMLRNKALCIWAAPEADYIVQAMVMAVIVEVLHVSQLQVLSWALTLPAILISVILIFYAVMFQCTI
jgi:hypothetical protein